MLICKEKFSLNLFEKLLKKTISDALYYKSQKDKGDPTITPLDLENTRLGLLLSQQIISKLSVSYNNWCYSDFANLEKEQKNYDIKK